MVCKPRGNSGVTLFYGQDHAIFSEADIVPCPPKDKRNGYELLLRARGQDRNE